jgi:hypothetical protein
MRNFATIPLHYPLLHFIIMIFMTWSAAIQTVGSLVSDGNLTATIINIVWGALLFFRIVGIIRTAKDSYARTKSTFKQFWSIILVTIAWPLVGIPLYLTLRPARYRERDFSLKESSSATCLHCHQRNDPRHTHCVFCGEKIHITCRECNNCYPASYAYCPDCGAPNIDQLVKV